jgi:hypothetical protein
VRWVQADTVVQWTQTDTVVGWVQAGTDVDWVQVGIAVDWVQVGIVGDWVEVGTADIAHGCTAQDRIVQIWDESVTQWGLWHRCHHLEQTPMLSRN